MRMLIVDDEPPRELLLAAVRAAGAEACHAAPGAPAAARAAETAPALVLVGPVASARADAAELVRALRAQLPELPVVVTSLHDRAAAAVEAMKAGAADYVVLSPATDLARRLRGLVCRQSAAASAAERATRTSLSGLVGESATMDQVRHLVRTAARADAHVLVEGETGTGKEVVARAIHGLGPRAERAFLPVNCAAIPETLAESEFFGHTRGAFTGALDARPGALRLADGGTLFLDEIEELPLALQAKLLRVVQDREVRPLGGSTAKRVDLRIVAASNRDLWRMVEAGGFRRDLYYRLRVLTIRLPPLRERRSDLPLLVAHFVTAFNHRHGTAFPMPPAAALRPLLEHAWPGNVRELENVLESLLILARAEASDLLTVLRRGHALGAGFWTDERTRILRVLEDHRWNRQRAAAALGISRVTLWRRMERHGIRDPLGGSARETA